MIKQQFKGMKLSRTKVKNNIISVFNLCEDRHMNDWYMEAKMWAIGVTSEHLPMFVTKVPGMDLSAIAPSTVNKVVGITAATSPMKRWEENQRLVVDFIKNGKCGHFGSVNEKCQAIMESDGTDTEILDILSGRKTQRFYMSINYCTSYDGVTIDRHALSIALGYRINNETFKTMTKRQYEFFEECYRYAAKSLGITPMLLQSSTWQVFRERKHEFPKEK